LMSTRKPSLGRLLVLPPSCFAIHWQSVCRHFQVASTGCTSSLSTLILRELLSIVSRVSGIGTAFSSGDVPAGRGTTWGRAGN